MACTTGDSTTGVAPVLARGVVDTEGRQGDGGVGEGTVVGVVKRMGSRRFSTGMSSRVASGRHSTMSGVFAGKGETGRESSSIRRYSAGTKSWLSTTAG